MGWKLEAGIAGKVKCVTPSADRVRLMHTVERISGANRCRLNQ